MTPEFNPRVANGPTRRNKVQPMPYRPNSAGPRRRAKTIWEQKPSACPTKPPARTTVEPRASHAASESLATASNVSYEPGLADSVAIELKLAFISTEPATRP